MRKTILMMLLGVVSSSASAEWVAVDSDETGTIYADPATIRRAGEIVKMWRLDDFKTLQTPRAGEGFEPYMSYMSQHEYDCKEERMRRLHFSFFSGNMRKGEVLSTGSVPAEWRPVPPGSIGEALWEVACGKR